MEKYTLTKNELKKLITAQLRLAALEFGGVDNWEWYSESIEDFIRNWAIETGKLLNKDWSFEDIVEEELKSYE